MKLSERALAVKESATLAIMAKGKEMKAAGVDMVSFSAGEPDFDTPKHIKQAAKKALDDGFTKYTATPGTLELRKAICEKLKNENGLAYAPNEIVVSTGAKQAIYNAFAAILDQGDEVLLPAPCWNSYTEIVSFCGGVPVLVYALEANGLKVTPAQLEAAKTPKTKALLLNSPCNPTGVVYGEAELKAIADFAAANDLWVVSDEIYEKLIYEPGLCHVSVASFSEDIKNRTIVINGFSKSFAMTGWRLGYSASCKEAAQVMGSIQSHLTSNANSIAQMAGLAALQGDSGCVEEMRSAFAERRDVIVERINALPGFSAVKPEGAFYVFANVEAWAGKTLGGIEIQNSAGLAEAILENCHVTTVPGIDFGYPNHLRFSYASSMADISKGMDRIEKFLKSNI